MKSGRRGFTLLMKNKKKQHENQDQLLEKEKQLDAAFQVLAARTTLGTQVAGVVFVFTPRVLCGACCWKRNS